LLFIYFIFLVLTLSGDLNEDEVIIIKKGKLINFAERIYYYLNDKNDLERREIVQSDLFQEIGINKVRNQPNAIEAFKKNLQMWKSHNNSNLEIELKVEIVWHEEFNNREKLICEYIDNTYNNNENYYLYKNLKSLEIYKNLYIEHFSYNEKLARKEIQKFISKHVNNSFAEKIRKRFDRFCDVSPFLGDAWWSICSIPISYWVMPSKEEWKELINSLNENK